jgi:hypothetical protein
MRGGERKMIMICRTIITALVLTAAWFTTDAVGEASSTEPPAAPSNFHGDVTGPFSWHDNSNNENGFRVYIQRPDMEPRLAAEFPANTTSGSVSYTFLENCSSTIWVVAFNTAGESEPSNTVQLSPPPGNCPATEQQTYVNDTGQPANALSITQIHAIQDVRLLANAPGCETPEITYYPFVVSWGEDACVDPNESITLEFDLLSPISLGISEWLHPAAASTTPTSAPTASASPAPTATPAALPNSGSPDSHDSSPLLWIGLAIAASGVLLLVRGGIAHRE